MVWELMKDILELYADQLSIPIKSLTHYDFEILISSWLKDLIKSEYASDHQIPKWLVASGLYDAIRHGSVVVEAPI
jgi:hypothetical protein